VLLPLLDSSSGVTAKTTTWDGTGVFLPVLILLPDPNFLSAEEWFRLYNTAENWRMRPGRKF
jgi:hypothetical protein